MTIQSIHPQILDPIDTYKQDYLNFSQFRGSRYKVLQQLDEYISVYQPFFAKVQSEGNYFYSFEFDYNKVEEKTIIFLNSTFCKTVVSAFISLPQKKIKDKFVKGKDSYFNLNKSKIFRAKVIAQISFLEHIRTCLEDYGLHEDVYKRSFMVYARYFVSISYGQEEERKISKLKTFEEINQNFVIPYLDRNDIFIKGSNISYACINNFQVAYSTLKDDEIPRHKLKNKLQNEGDLFDESPDVTDFFVNTRKVNHNFIVGKEIWDMVHPKIRKEVKSLIKSQQYDKAVLAACIEYLTAIKVAYKTKIGDELDGVSLINKAFSVNNPVFQLAADLTTDSGKNEQKGLMMMASGAISAFRNPPGHENRVISQQDAMHKILLVSYLLKTFEQHQV